MNRKDWKFKTGLALIIVSVILFLVFPFIPFIDMEKKTKVIISTSVFISAEVMFYSGGLLLGKQLIKKYKSIINPKNWFIKKPVSSEKINENEDDRF